MLTLGSGLKFFALVEELRESLRKKVDVLELNQLENNQDLLNEGLKEGIKFMLNSRALYNCQPVCRPC